jgi:hypothetical protein
MEELTELSRRNDELMTAKDADLAVIRDLDAQCKDYKRKYELAKTELRGLKGWSSLWALRRVGLLKVKTKSRSDIPTVPSTTKGGRQFPYVSRWSNTGHSCHRICLCGR